MTRDAPSGRLTLMSEHYRRGFGRHERPAEWSARLTGHVLSSAFPALEDYTRQGQADTPEVETTDDRV